MIRKGSQLLLIATLLVLSSAGYADAASSKGGTVDESANTVHVLVVGSFNGCTALDPAITPATQAVLDLIRPSAFLTSSNGSLSGAGGAISSAELVSLSPETIQYSTAPGEKWSDGTAFNAAALVSWWNRAKNLANTLSYGYRDIASMTLSKSNQTVTAVLKTPFADWNQLFRDVESPRASSDCSLSSLVSRPSIGPYKVVNASASTVTLSAVKSWPYDTARFGKVVLSTSALAPTRNAEVVAYSNVVNRATVGAFSSNPNVSTHIGTSSAIEMLMFSEKGYLSHDLRTRDALSVSINRSAIINQLWGAVTFAPQPASSALYSQGQQNYPGPNSGSGLSSTTTSQPSGSPSPQADCVSCAVALLKADGYVKSASGWFRNGSRLAMTLMSGPTDLDHALANYIVSQWARIEIPTTIQFASSDELAAQATTSGAASASIFSRPTGPSPSITARSWCGPSWVDSYSSGIRTPAMSTLCQQALSNFNPVNAAATWASLDSLILSNFYCRPLVTAPSLLISSADLSNVVGSSSLVGFIDEIPTWSQQVIQSQLSH